MKSKIFFLLIAIIAILSNYEAQAQNPCDICVAPKTCYVLTIPVTGCGYVTYTFCYQCFVTNNSINVDIIDINKVCPGMEDAVWDAVFNWIAANKASLCGSRPCEEGPPSHVRITYPKCGTMVYDGNTALTYRIKYNSNQSCNTLCIVEYDWCYCNCVDPCASDFPCPSQTHVMMTNKTKSFDSAVECQKINRAMVPGTSWQIDCQLFDTPCDHP